MFNKILIANRGEIALRIIRACRELGIRTVAIYSSADENSLHARFADEAICIGPPEASLSYLNFPNIISAAEITDAEAIHPGYGFLAENASFAEVCESCQIKFIGPTPENIRLMGNKIQARDLMIDAGVPVLPGREIKGEDHTDALKVASEIGFPVMIKAAAGGGGKGMRTAHTELTLINYFHTARAEAQSAFGSPDLYIEKYVDRSRHVEVQVLADGEGNVIHLGDRDCTIQRRYQKIIEESPSPALDDHTREEMAEMTVRAARAVDYVNAGTVEFLVDQKGKYYFMEMNTRIQVEHPVTEMVTGLDLIKEQILIASGERLRCSQEDIRFRGHSIEARINAEDPDTLMPSPGRIQDFHLPGGNGVRVDTAIYSGCYISPHYDPLIAKLIVWSGTRDGAIRKLRCALEEFHIEGIKTNIPHLLRIVADKRFREGKHYTKNVDQ